MKTIHPMNLDYLTDINIISAKVTHLDLNGLKICNDIHIVAMNIYNCLNEPNILDIVDNNINSIMIIIDNLYVDTDCQPNCTNIINERCLKCNMCKPSCIHFNHKCFKCNPNLLTFNNSERLNVNKSMIKNLLYNFFTGNNEMAGVNTLALIKIHLSVLPSLVIRKK